MRIIWEFETEDIQAAKAIVEAFNDHPMLRKRRELNLSNDKPPVSKDRFWKGMVGALLTTRQRSGPTSPVFQILALKRFPLSYRRCRIEGRVDRYARGVLAGHRGIRRYDTIAREIAANLDTLDGGFWPELSEALDSLRGRTTRRLECEVADLIDDRLGGFGPKQARNLLQALGLTRYETPLDSRITKWLSSNGFPIQLSATGLQDRANYGLVMDGIYQLCRASHTYPCLFDAAVFVSYDSEGWTQDIVAW